MSARTAPLALAVILALAASPMAPAATAAQDSRAPAAVATPHFKPEQAAEFSKEIERDLAQRGARVAMVFRLGRPQQDLPPGLAYTHGAFWVHRTLKTETGETTGGYAVYNLYAGDGQAWPTTQSRLVQDWPADFVRGSTVDDVAVIIPSPEMQRRILAVIDSPTYERLHNPDYTLIANPWETRHQNCNSFMLDVIAAAAWDTDDPVRITRDLRQHFRPTIVRPNLLTRVFGPMSDARLRTDDQSGDIRTASYESLAAFLREYSLLQATYSIAYAPASQLPAVSNGRVNGQVILDGRGYRGQGRL